MDVGTYAAVSGGITAQERLDAITNNLANASTPGFKAELLAQEALEDGTTKGTLKTNFANGPIEATGNTLDVAISGPGFLVVDTPRGERLTRNGRLALDADGILTTSEGYRVQGEGGSELRVRDGRLTIDPSGAIKSGNQQVGSLRLATVASPDKLTRENGTFFAPGREKLVEVDPQATRIVQSALEGANVSPIESLVALIETMRGFEAYMQAAQKLDDMTGRAITDVGRV